MADVNIRINLRDNASSGFGKFEQRVRDIQRRIADDAKKAAQEQERLDRRREQSAQRRADAERRAAQESVRAAREMQDAHVRAYQTVNNARNTLGIRTHQQIRADMARVQQAYRDLANAGNLSFREQVQAANALRNKLRELNNEMGQLTRAQKAAGMAGAVAGGVLGAVVTMRQPIKNALDYERRLSYMAITAFPERDVNGKAAGQRDLDRAVIGAVKDSGLGVDGVANILETLISGGQFKDMSTIYDFLPELSRIAKANNADPGAVARLTSTLYGQGTVKNKDELLRANDIIVAVGQKSGFEYKDQVMYLPMQLPLAQGAGLRGLEGLAKVATLNATSFMTNGDAAMAATATRGILNKVVSHDTAKSFEGWYDEQDQRRAEAMGIKPKKGTKTAHTPEYDAAGGDLHRVLMQHIEAGKGDALSFWEGIVNQAIAEDSNLREIKARLDKSTSRPEQAELLAKIEGVAKQGVIGTFFQELRGENGLLGWLNAAVREPVLAEAGRAARGEFKPSAANFEFINKTNPARTDRALNAYELEQKRLLEHATPTLANAADKLVSASGNHPVMSGLAAAAPWVAGTGAGAWAGYKLMGGSGAGASIIGGLSTLISNVVAKANLLVRSHVVGQAGSAVAQGAARVGAMAAPYAAPAAAVGGAGFAGFQIGKSLVEPINNLISKWQGHETSLGGFVYDMLNWEPPPIKVDPIQVNTQSNVNVSLDHGLIASMVRSAATSNKPAGTAVSPNATTNTGNIFNGAPG